MNTARDDYGVFIDTPTTGKPDEGDTDKIDNQLAETIESGRVKKTQIYTRAGVRKGHERQ